jgi:hypothetical protein
MAQLMEQTSCQGAKNDRDTETFEIAQAVLKIKVLLILFNQKMSMCYIKNDKIQYSSLLFLLSKLEVTKPYPDRIEIAKMIAEYAKSFLTIYKNIYPADIIINLTERLLSYCINVYEMKIAEIKRQMEQTTEKHGHADNQYIMNRGIYDFGTQLLYAPCIPLFTLGGVIEHNPDPVKVDMVDFFSYTHDDMQKYIIET